MSRFFDLVSKPARDMSSYPPAAPQKPPAAQSQPRLIHLDSNENPFGPSLRAIEAIRSTLAGVHSYPDDDSSALRDRLSEHHSLPLEQILVTAGSTGMLGLLCQTMLGPGLNAVTSERSFIVYAMAVHASGAQLIETPMRDDGFDLAAILDAINEDTRLVFLANPNNPTGTMLDAAAVHQFLEEVPGHVVVVLDEAYFEFAAHFASLRGIEYSRSLDYVRKGASVVVLRTFSKAHGLAGLRIGYGLGPAELIAYCARMRNTYSVSSVGQLAALAALDDKLHIGRTVANNTAQAQVLTNGLSELNFRVVPTSANFVCCDVGEDALEVVARVRHEGISIRALGTWGAPTYIRISIGTPKQNETLLQAARKVAHSKHSRH
jgi:histidinol-phosphate aminotransferase